MYNTSCLYRVVNFASCVYSVLNSVPAALA